MPYRRALRYARDPRFPGVYPVLAPLSVILSLVLLQDVRAAFVIYHVVICLLVPVFHVVLITGGSLRELGDEMGLRGFSDPATWLAGLATGALMGGGIVGGYLLAGDLVLAGEEVRAVAASWGIGPEDTAFLVGYMLVMNSGAEELFWRGFVHERMAIWPRRQLAIWLTTGAFASYHLFTIWALLGDWLVAGAATVAIFAAALVWGELRERYDSLLPALLGHLGATAGYMAVYALYIV